MFCLTSKIKNQAKPNIEQRTPRSPFIPKFYPLNNSSRLEFSPTPRLMHMRFKHREGHSRHIQIQFSNELHVLFALPSR